MKKIISEVVIICITAVILSACESSDNTGMANNEISEDLKESTTQEESKTKEESTPIEVTSDNEDLVEEVSDNKISKEVVEEEAELIPSKAVIEVSDMGYDGLVQLSDHVFWVKVGDVASVIDEDGNKFVEGNITAAKPLYYDGYFYILIDGLCTLYDKDGNKVMDCADYPGYYYDSVYKDGIQLSSVKNGTADSIYLNWKGEELLRVNSSIVKGIKEASPLINGVVDVATWDYFDGEHMANICMEDGTLACIPETNPEYKYGVHTYGYSMGADGYVFARPMAQNRHNDLGLFIYSFKDEKYIPLPEPADSFWWYQCFDGVKHSIFEGQYAIIYNENDNKKALFDVKSEKLVTDFKYGSISMQHYGYEKYVLISDEKEEKWSFLDENLEEIGKWYDDASYFVDKCAVVKDETGIYVVNENFEQISEPIEGDASIRFFNNYVGIIRGDKCYLAEIKYE